VAFYSDFAEYYDAVFPLEEDVLEYLESFLEEGSRRVLDVGCGTGDFCGRFAAMGLEAVGIDVDPRMIETARGRHPDVAFHALDMLDVGTLEPPFDMAYCIGNVAAHVRQGVLPSFLTNVAGLLEPGASWLLQTVNWDYILGLETFAFPDTRVVMAGGEGADTPRDIVFSRRYEDISDERLHFLTKLTENGETVFEGDVWLHPMRRDDYVRIHEDSGLTLLGHFANFRRDPFVSDRRSSSVYAFRRP